MSKRIFSLLLAVVMVLSLLPVAAFAEEEADVCEHSLLTVTNVSDVGINTSVAYEWGLRPTTSPNGNLAYEVSRRYRGGLGESKVEMTIANNPAEITLPVSWYRKERFQAYGKFRIIFQLDGVTIPDVGGDYTGSDSDWTGWKTEQITIPEGTHVLTFSVTKTAQGSWSGGNVHAVEIPYISAFNHDSVCTICGHTCPHSEFYQNFDTNDHWLVCTDPTGCEVEIPRSRDAHLFDENGNCEACAYSTLELDEDGYYKIGNAQQLLSFANLVNVNHATTINAKLTADINMAGIASFRPIGSAQYPYEGTFDGQGHRITHLKVDLPEEDFVGVIGAIRNTVVKNVVIDKTCSFVGRNCVAPLGTTSGSGASLHLNCGNEADVTAMNDTACGLASNNGDLINCYSTGTVRAMNGSKVGGLTDKAAWMLFYNCYFAGELYENGDTPKASTLFWWTGYYESTANVSYSEAHSFAPDAECLTDGTLLEDIAQELTVGENVYPVQYIAGATHPVLFEEPEVITDADEHDHEYSVSYEWLEEGTVCNAVAACDIAGCEVDGNFIEETVAAHPSFVGKVEGTSIGIYAYTANFTNPMFETQVKDKNVMLSSEITELRFSDVKPDGFTVSWDVPASTHHFVLDIATDAEFENCIEGFHEYVTRDFEVSVKGLDFGTTYYCRVNSVDAQGVPSAYVDGSVTTTGTVPEVTAQKNTIVLNHNDFVVNKLSIAYIGTSEADINDWASFVAAGKEYPEINSVLGYKQYTNPTDGKTVPEFDTGFYAAYVRYLVNGVATVKYDVVYVEAPIVPSVEVDNGDIVLSHNEATVTKMSIAFVGKDEVEVRDWNSFVAAGMVFTDINGKDGYKQYTNPADGKRIAETQSGLYAVYIRYDVNGVIKTKYQVVDLVAPILPEAIVEKGHIGILYNDYEVNKVSIAYIGNEYLTINNWTAFEKAGKKFPEINGSVGCMHHSCLDHGKYFEQTETGFYAVYIRYNANGVNRAIYQVVHLDAVTLPEVTSPNPGELVVNANGFDVNKISYAYIGTQSKDVVDWESFVAAGKEYTNENGTDGYLQVANPADGKVIEVVPGLYAPGYYAVHLRYTVNGANVARYMVVRVERKATPMLMTTAGFEGNTVAMLRTRGLTVEKVSIAYIGTESKLIKTWNAFAKSGQAYADINGKLGYKQYNNPVDRDSFSLDEHGYYAFYIRYIDLEGNTCVMYTVVNV